MSEAAEPLVYSVPLTSTDPDIQALEIMCPLFEAMNDEQRKRALEYLTDRFMPR